MILAVDDADSKRYATPLCRTAEGVAMLIRPGNRHALSRCGVTIQHVDNGAGETPPAGAIKFPECREASG